MVYQRLSEKHTLSVAVKSLQAGLFGSLHGADWLQKCRKISPGTSGYSQARCLLPVSLVIRAVDIIISDVLEKLNGRLKWYNREVFLVDGSSLSAPHEEDIMERYPVSRNKRECYWPVIRIVTCHHLLSGIAVRPSIGPMYGPNRVSEQSLLKKQMTQLPLRSVIVADGNFGTFACTHHARTAGHDVVVRLSTPRLERILRLNNTSLSQGSVTWYASPSDLQNNREIPKGSSIKGKIIKASFKTPFGERKVIHIFTTLRHAPGKVAALYAQRWWIETDLRSIKDTVDMRVLNCKTADMVEKEIATGILAYSLVRATMAIAALRAGKEPRELSFSNTIDVIHAYLPVLQQAKTKIQASMIAETLLDQIARCEISKRKKKRKPQPRVKRGRSTPYRISNRPRRVLEDALFIESVVK
jgi:hypothetical protein